MNQLTGKPRPAHVGKIPEYCKADANNTLQDNAEISCVISRPKYSQRRRDGLPWTPFNSAEMNHPLFAVWRSMIRRCTNPKDSGFHRYGGRGIKVCDRWANDFWAFVADMGERPPKHSIDRINNDGNYEPNNCRWATRIEQNANRANTRMAVFRGQLRTITDIAREVGIDQDVLRIRIIRGMQIELAVSRPVQKRAANQAEAVRS